MTIVFSPDDLHELTVVVHRAWASGAGLDWSQPAGTLEWSCTQTADHAVDTLLAPAFQLASRFDDHGVSMHWGPVFTMGPDVTVEQLLEGLDTASRLLWSVVVAAEPGASALIWGRPPEVKPAADFIPRGALELALHAHDVCSGLHVPFEPPAELSLRLREHTRDWPHWQRWGSTIGSSDDAWGDLLAASGRHRQAA